jgi:TMEM175 potassium channel family protein
MSERQTPIVSEGHAVEDDEPSVGGSRESDYDIGRLMAFSDGVFAVAITLLVFNVRLPAFAQNEAMSQLPNALLRTAPALLTFALSFFLVGFYWIRHHQLFRQVVSADVWLLWLNLIVLFLICLLPFSAGVVGQYHNTVIGAEVYAVNLGAIAVGFSALYLYATRAHQVRPLPPGMGVGFFSQGLLLPVVVVAMVMALAPLNLVVAYVTGVTLMALVGIYTAAVPESVSTAPIRGASGGRLRFPRGAALVTVRAQTAMPDLFWARFTGKKPGVRVVANAVDIESRRSFRPGAWRLQSAQIALNASIPWEFEVQEGAWRFTADFRDLQLSKVAFGGGASKVDLHLPHPSGTVPIHFGAATDVTVRRPAGVAVSVVVHGDFGKLQVDGKSIEATDKLPIQSSGYAREADRYAIELTGGAYRFVIATEPEIRHRGSAGRRRPS